MRILVTGFEPFAGLAHNPSRALLDMLPNHIDDHAVVKACLPVDTQQAPQVLRELYQAHTPAVAVHLGLAAGRPLLSLERLAINVLDFEIPDNAGVRLRDQPILPQAPLALASRLPLRQVQAAWQQMGIPGVISNSAGTYLCNQIMFLALSWLPPEVPTGFIHLPPDEYLAQVRPQAYVPLQVQTQAVAQALKVTLQTLTPQKEPLTSQ